MKTTDDYGRYATWTLDALCSDVASFEIAFEDCAQVIEDKAFRECEAGKVDETLSCLQEMAGAIEALENKNEEIINSLTNIYLLIGEICQYYKHYRRSIEWFEKALIVNDQSPDPYHSLGISYGALGDSTRAAKCYAHEIELSPGNYYTYLLLADIYFRAGMEEDAQNILHQLLLRDPENIQALHRLIGIYENSGPNVDSELLTRRIIKTTRPIAKSDLIIWSYHMCREGKFVEAIDRCNQREVQEPDISTTNLIKAYIYGELGQYSQKRRELMVFKQKNGGREIFIQNTLQEFGAVFGEKVVSKLGSRLLITNPSRTM
jgi:tetratricopeptide (TPR) repeat protein